jgi:hypothetical protein
MSPKATSVKNKKESKDSKRPDSPVAAGSAPVPRPEAPSNISGGMTRKGSSYQAEASNKDTYFPKEFDMGSLDDVKEEVLENEDFDNEDSVYERVKFSEYFSPLARMMIKVFLNKKTITGFPVLIRKIVDRKKDSFLRLDELSHTIARLIDNELIRLGLIKNEDTPDTLCSCEAYDYGDGLDLRIDSFYKDTMQEFYLSTENYEEMFIMAYDVSKDITLHVHIDDLFHTSEGMKKKGPEDGIKLDNYKMENNEYDGRQAQGLKIENEVPTTFRGIPIDLSGSNQRQCKREQDDALNDLQDMGFDRRAATRHVNANFTPRKNILPTLATSPISIHDEDDYRVLDPTSIVPFAQESVQNRIADLQSIAMTNIPDVSSIPKLLKSHNVSFKKDDNASTWYQRFHNFCAMIGIYLPPPKAMEKNSIMGKEWDSGNLPKVFYSRFPKMKKVLTHILFAPEFFPKDLQDDLQLNPHPYNFLRLFMALHSHAVPDLSDRVIKRPSAMKISQSLSQYALLWVNYFLDEANVNGVRYSKFRQYCYFLDGLPPKFSIIRKFLEMEFTSSHDKIDNIPISLELRNLPSTILSLAQVHGISVSNAPNNIHKVSDDDLADCGDKHDAEEIKIVNSSSKNNPSNKKNIVKFKSVSGTSGVQCWLCDGPHSFRQCNELSRMKRVCIKRPSVLKHFQQLLLDKNGEAIRILMEAPEFFDDAAALDSAHSEEPSPSPNEDPSNDNAADDQVNSLHLGTNDVDNEDVPTLFDVISCLHDVEDYPSNRHWNNHHDEMQILSVSDSLTDLPSVKMVDNNLVPRVQVDGGADRSITPHRELIHDFRLPDPTRGDKTQINDAGVHAHQIVGYGHFRVRCLDSSSKPRYINIPCAYIPSIPSTLLNFRTMPRLVNVNEISNMLLGVGVANLTLLDANDEPYHLVVPLMVYRTRLYADNVLLRCDEFSSIHKPCIPVMDNGMSDNIQIVSDEPTKLLWHARLGHLNFRSLSEMYKFADGIPKFKQSRQMENCSTCLVSKLRRSPRGHGTIADRAEVHGQVLCGDWGFVCQNSSDPTRVPRLTSVYGDTSYLIFTCAYTGALYGVCASSKSVPTKWLHIFLHRISSGVGDRPKTILVDRGSELGRSTEFKRIAELHGYIIPTAGPDKSTMNGMGERPHSTIGDAIRSLLYSSGLDQKYWNFAFYHYLRLYNLVPHGDRSSSPFELIRGRKPDISRLRVFGCDVFIRPPGRRPSKLDNHAIRGRFLGYTSTLKQIYYLEYGTSKIKVAANVRFDEGMSTVPLEQLPPYVLQLRRALGQSTPMPQPDEHISAPDDIDLLTSSELFPITFHHEFIIKPSDIYAEYDTLGFIINDDPQLRRCYITDILPRSTAASYPRWRVKLIGCFILCIGDDIITDKQSAEAALSRHLVDSSSTTEPYTVNITFASDKALLRDDHVDVEPSPIQLDQICHISTIIETGEEWKYQTTIDLDWVEYFDNLVYSVGAKAPSIEDEGINKVSTSQFTRRQLMAQGDFQEWLQAEFKQLDRHEEDGMFGDPCPRPALAIILRSIWSYVLKWNGEKKARHCCDGRPLRDDKFRRIESVYTACISQVGMKIFMALAALLNYVILDLDAVNAFGQAGSLYDIIYLEIYQQYRDWYKSRKGKDIPIGWVLPVKGSLQGHPDSGEIWQTRVNEVLEMYSFQTTTHEPCLYRGNFKGKQILICRQIDDMLVAGEDMKLVKDFASELSKHLKITIGNEPSTHYNGIDILQTREGIKISCTTYIQKLQKAHGWNAVSSKPLEPIDPNRVKELESTEGPNIDSPEGKLLKKRNGFNYRGVVGEIVYAHITGRPDYAFSVSLLSRFNTCPAQCHYDEAKRCLKSLIRTADVGIWYWRRSPRMDLPESTHQPREMEEFEKKFPILKDPFLVSGICDVSIAPGILMRRSFGGTMVLLGNLYLILYLGKLQPVVASSTGEGEFIQMVLTGKKIKYVRTVMTEFGFPQKLPSPMFGDNLSAIMMANNVRPTDRTRHMDIRWFALQEWIHVDKDIIVIHISGTINPADALTKALAWKKHYRHMSRAMGHLGSPYAPGIYRLKTVPIDSIKALFMVPT